MMVNKSIALILALLCSAPAFAGHPMITDDTGTQGRGRYLLEFNCGFSTNNIDANGGMAGALTLGITDNVDLSVAPPYQWAPAKGIGDIPVQVKWRIFGGEQSGLSFGFGRCH